MSKELAELCEIRNYRKGDIILLQNDKADGMYIIKSGQAEVERDGEVLTTLKEGDYFGEMSLLLHERRSATIRVTSEGLSVFYLSKKNYEEVKDELNQEVIDKTLKRYSETYREYI